MLNQLSFTSKLCKDGVDGHQQCIGAWEGFGCLVICECLCHETEKVLDVIDGATTSNTFLNTESSSKEITQRR
jgi:hypothetical protein